MKPPIPNIIAHAEPSGAFNVKTAIVVVLVIAVVAYFIYRAYNDPKTN